jgi:hypothetical protein
VRQRRGADSAPSLVAPMGQHALVPSWRDTASQRAQDDLDRLLNEALPFAQQMLDKSGEFYPYGAAIGADGQVAMFGADPGQGEHPKSSDVIAMLVGGLRAKRADLRAAAVVADVRAGESDAIRVQVEHREGPVLTVLLPYKKKRLGRGIEYGQMRASAAEAQVWTDT